MPSDNSKNMPDPTYESVNTDIKGPPQTKYQTNASDMPGSGAARKAADELQKRRDSNDDALKAARDALGG